MDTEPSDREEYRALVAGRGKRDHPVITCCAFSSPRLPSFCEGSPYLFPESIDLFVSSLREDIALMSLERAKPVFRRLAGDEVYPIPESCTPYLDANSTGFYLKPVLPIVFVRTARGELLLEARVAMKYLRENADRFRSELDKIESWAQVIFQPERLMERRGIHPRLFTDIIQPYSSFTNRHISLRAGLWVHTPDGLSTIIGPPINQPSPLHVVAGAIETDWHHFELFIVLEAPHFEDRVLIIEPGTVIAQLYFVDRRAHEGAEIRFSNDDPGADPAYWAGWDQLARRLVESGKGLSSERGGVASVQIGCPHCYVSVTSAAESGVPEGHTVTRSFNPLYKILKHESRKLAGEKTEEYGECSGER